MADCVFCCECNFAWEDHDMICRECYNKMCDEVIKLRVEKGEILLVLEQQDLTLKRLHNENERLNIKIKEQGDHIKYLESCWPIV